MAKRNYYKIGAKWGSNNTYNFYGVMKKNKVIIYNDSAELKIGDVGAVAKDGGANITDLGIVISNIEEFSTNPPLKSEFDAITPDISKCCSYYKVEWIDISQNFYGSNYSRQGLTIINKPDAISEIDKRINEYNNKKMITDILKLVETNKNLILTGAPGTGKTFTAKEIAKQMKAETKLVQFHPAYDYTDFVEGLRPLKKERTEKEIGFERKDGVFKEFCKKALSAFNEDKSKNENEKRKFVFIIDEINRGEISKIFGELFFSIDPSYRGERGKVQTQYQKLIEDGDVFKDGFFVPENVYIIGTMNDIDRSVESFDFAMRRRFTWQEITAEESAENMKLSEATKNKMKSLNEAISKIEGLNSSYHIGGAYFLDKDGKERTDYDKIWKLRLRPLLFEYLRGTSDAESKLENLENAYNR